MCRSSLRQVDLYVREGCHRNAAGSDSSDKLNNAADQKRLNRSIRMINMHTPIMASTFSGVLYYATGEVAIFAWVCAGCRPCRNTNSSVGHYKCSRSTPQSAVRNCLSVLPDDYSAARTYYLIEWCHGMGADEQSMLGGINTTIVNTMLPMGYLFCASNAHGDNWGNDAALLIMPRLNPTCAQIIRSRTLPCGRLNGRAFGARAYRNEPDQRH